MLVNDYIEQIRDNTLPNYSRADDPNDEKLLKLINEGLITLHSLFSIKKEQAIIFVPANRRVFKIDDSDPQVVMATISKMIGIWGENDELLDKENKFNKLVKKGIRSTSNRTSTGNSPMPLSYPENSKVLALISVYNQLKQQLYFNTSDLIVIDQITIHLSKAKENELYYVEYKPYPLYPRIDEELDIPDTLLECLSGFVAMKIYAGVESFKQFYPNSVNAYNRLLEEALHSGAVITESVESSLQLKKGFY